MNQPGKKIGPNFAYNTLRNWNIPRANMVVMPVGPFAIPTPGGETFYILQEDGFRIILEDGTGFCLLEIAP